MILATALNAGALGLASSASLRHAVLSAEKQDQRLAMVMLIASNDRDTKLEPVAEATVLRAASSGLGRPFRRHVTARTTREAPHVEAPAQVLFYSFNEVDDPAFPESDWNLDVESLDRIGAQRLVFEVLINDHGTVVGCTVLEPLDLADDVKRELERRLSETSVLPAVRAGQLVASVRRIELLVAPVQPEAQLPDPLIGRKTPLIE